MKKFQFFTVLFAVIAVGYFTLTPTTHGKTEKLRPARQINPIANKYLVAFNEEYNRNNNIRNDSNELAGRMASEYGAGVEKTFSNALKGFVADMSAEQAARMKKDPRVRLIEQDSVFEAFDAQTNPDWGLDRVDQRTSLLDTSYSYTRTGYGVNVYLIDTGISPSHSDFDGRAVAAFDSVGDGQNGVDCNGHGTHVAGIVGGSTYGVAKRANLYGVRVLGCNGLGSLSSVVAGLDWVAANYASPAIVNMSMGGGASDFLDFVVNGLLASGVPVVAAAGNSKIDACNVSPARVPGVVTVGATGRTDEIWNDPNIDYLGSNVGGCLDVFAPGAGIRSAWIGSDTASNTGSGTSMAAPHVTGAAALYIEGNQTATPAEVQHQIVSKATMAVVSQIDGLTPNLLLFTEPFAPTAASVTVSGRVVDQYGRGIKNVTVQLQGAGADMTIRTSSFGYYKFEDIEAGGFVVVSVVAKRYIFQEPSIAFVLRGPMSDIDFVGGMDPNL